MSEGLSPYQKQLKQNASESLSRLGGMYAAKVWIVLPALLALPVMWVFGEGDYIVPILGLGWAALFFVGLRLRRSAAVGSIRRSTGFWVSFWSAFFAISMFGITAATALDGAWRWSPP